MTVPASVLCLVVGAVLTFAIETDSAEGINVNNVGIILMLVGIVGLVAYYAIWGPRTRRVAGRADTVVIEDRRAATPVVEERVVRSTPVVERRIYEG